jgi:hypothetical protein
MKTYYFIESVIVMMESDGRGHLGGDDSGWAGVHCEKGRGMASRGIVYLLYYLASSRRTWR